jgi:hypothetical protein
MGKFIDLTKLHFGSWEVITKAYTDEYKGWWWYCLCECGTLRAVSSRNLISRHSTSCGCRGKFRLQNRKKHGMSRTPLGGIRSGMIYRCHNSKCKAYKHYGGRGITVCDEWRDNPSSFYTWAVLTGYKEGLSIERIDNNGNYEPGNCKWIPRKEQPNNQRSSHYLTYNGEIKTIADWSRHTGISKGTISDRIRRGWSDEKTLGTPPRLLNDGTSYKGQPSKKERKKINEQP